MKIEFESISFKNFLAFGNKTQTMNIEHGLNLILGIDHATGRSNGSAKSSFFDAITFALYGKTNRAINKNKIINWKNRKNCEVEIIFKIGANKFRINRGIKPDYLEIYKNGTVIPQPPDVRQYQKMLENDILKIDFHMFISLVHINLNNYTPFLQMDTPKKRLFLEKMFGLEMFSDLNKISNEKLVTIETQLTQHNTEIKIKSKIKDDLIQKQVLLNTQIKELVSSKTGLDKIIVKLGKTENPESTINDLTKEKQILVDKQTELTKKETEISTSIGFLTKEQSTLSNNIDKKTSDIETHKESKVIHDQIVESNKDIDKLVDEKRSERQLLVAEITKVTEEISQINAQLASSQTSYNHYVSNMHILSDKTECPICMTKVSKTTILPNIQDKIDEHKKSIDSLTKKLKKLGNKLTGLNEEHDSINISSLLEKQKTYYEALSKKESTDAIIKSIDIKSDKKRLDEIKKELKSINSEHKSILTEINSLQKQISKIDKSLETLQEKSKIYNDLLTEKTVLEEKLIWEAKTRADLIDQIKLIDNQISDIEKECKKITGSVTGLSNLKDYITYIKTLCKDENVKQFAISSIMPYLTKRINEYLSKAGMSYFVNFNNLLEDDIKGPGIYGASYGNLSGGESKSVDLAILFAMLDVSRLQFGVYPDILLIDELLDSAIDGRGIDAVMKIIWLRQKEDNSKVYLITHRSDWSEVSEIRKYLVEKNNGFSTIKEIEN